ncbi:MAG: WbqC family protein [Deltaproteobacteria bacterium]|jgi:hypothetical protein|nr:WbqC family protein [Deltaproteobacteria bacterium]
MNAPRLVAVHQPNFFPWLGYFDKILRAEVFIILDDAQFPKTGAGTWSNRVKMLLGEPKWFTMPVVRNYHGMHRYDEVRIDESRPWRDAFLTALRAFYGRTLGFAEGFPLCEPLIRCPASSLVEYNLNALTGLLDILSLPRGHLRRASEFAVNSRGTERLIDLVKAVGGNAYLAGGGAGSYQEDGLFAERGVSLVHQNFQHPEYDQGGAFVSGLSVLDALFRLGVEETRRILFSERERSSFPPRA